MTGVEKVRIADTASTSATVNLAGITGVETVESFGSAGTATSFTNVGNVVNLSLANTSGLGTNTVSYTAAASTGTTTQNIALSSATGTGTTTIADVEVVNITAEGGSSLDLIASSATDVNVDATDSTTITLSNAANTALTSISAAESDAKVTFAIDFTLAEVAVTGGSAGDIFSVSGNLGFLDSLDGGDGIDTIYKASGTNVTAVASTLAAISNVEVAAFDAFDDTVVGTQADFTIDMDTLEGVSIISLTARDLGTANVFTLNDLTTTQAANISVGYKTGAIGATVDIDFKDGTGTADAAVVNVSAKAGTTTLIQDTANTADELTVNVGSSDITTTTVTIDAADFDTKLTVTGGSAGRTLDMDGTAITSDTIDMSTVAANIKLQLGADTQTVTLGTGDDLVDMNANYTSADSIDGGDGTDTVLLESASSLTSALNFTNVEKVRFASSANVTLNASGLDNVTIVDGAAVVSAAANVVTLLNFAGSSLDILGANGNAGTQTINAISLSNSFSGSADALTMRIDGTDSTGADDDIDVGDITINGVETLTVTLADLVGLTLGDGAADGIAGNNLTSVTINGGDAGIFYDLGDIVGLAAGRIESVDMSGLVGNVTVEVSGLEDAAIINLGIGTNDVTATEGTGSAQGVTITGNTGADTITGTGLADVINGGGGIDYITGGAGIDTLSGGAGSDTFVYDTIAAAADANNVIDFAAGSTGDVVQFDEITSGAYAALGTNVLVTASLAAALDLGGVFDNAANAVGSNYIVVDTAANIGAIDITVAGGGTGLTVAGMIAVASDTGDIYYDLDGDFADAVVIGTLSITGSLTAANFSIV